MTAKAVTIRPATAGDGPALRAIERAAGERFREVGLAEVADDEPAPEAVLTGYAAGGRSWVAVDEAGAPLGYALADIVDGNAHVEQVSVHPDHQGAGVGRALIDQIRQWADEQRLAALTLTTFTDVPWNAPLYRHLGFRTLAEDEIGPELRSLRETEAAHGLDPEKRVCMTMPVATARR